MELNEMKVCELIDELAKEKEATDTEEEEGKRIDKIVEEIESRYPFSYYKQELSDLTDEIEKLKEEIGKIQYFVAGANISALFRELKKKEK